MPFLETARVEQRIRLLADYDTGVFAVSELCAGYGVSRETFYAWRARRAAGGENWFVDRSHAPGRCPHRTGEALAARVLAVRGRFPHFGPKKIRAWLRQAEPGVAWPAASTIGDLLARAGLIESRPRRRRSIERGAVVDHVRAPNAEWCCDFKGWFRTRDGRRCDPLTITDAFSRYLVEARIAEPSIAGVRPVFEAAFRAHGLPQAIRCDNGSPFGSRGPAGLTGLSVWWLRLGVEPRFITPASPQENGRHERMHRTLKAAASLAEQQARFDDFRHHFNSERPHEALGQVPPARLWRRSARTMPERLEDPWYDADHQVRRVRTAGEIQWRGQLVYIGTAFVGQLVGLAEGDNGRHVVRLL